MSALGDKVKIALRLSDSTLVGEIEDMIEEATEDMTRIGIADTAAEETALGRKAVIAYCKSRYAVDAAERSAYYEAYQTILDEMRRSSEYRAEEST